MNQGDKLLFPFTNHEYYRFLDKHWHIFKESEDRSWENFKRYVSPRIENFPLYHDSVKAFFIVKKNPTYWEHYEQANY